MLLRIWPFVWARRLRNRGKITKELLYANAEVEVLARGAYNSIVDYRNSCRKVRDLEIKRNKIQEAINHANL